MKSAYVYKVITSSLSPILKKEGFKKISSSQPKWYINLDNYSLHLYLKTHKYPWEPFCGCSIAMRTYICPKETPINEVESDFFHSRRFFEKDSEEIEVIRKRHELVVDKIKNIDLQAIIDSPDNWYDDIDELKVLHNGGGQFIGDHKTTKGVLSFIDTELLYLDESDVEFWRNFYAKYSIKNIKRIISDEENRS